MSDAYGDDVLLVWRYDRFAPSMQELVNALEEFRTPGIDFEPTFARCIDIR